MAWEKPSPDSDNAASPSPFQAFFTNYNGGSTPGNGFKVQAAYGMNRYLYDASLKYPAATWNKGFFAYQPAPNDRVANTTFWKLQSPTMGQIPMLMDCRWREVYVDKNTEDYHPKNASDKGMSLTATRRH